MLLTQHLIIIITVDRIVCMWFRRSAVCCRCWQWRLYSTDVYSWSNNWDYVTVDVNNSFMTCVLCLCCCSCLMYSRHFDFMIS